MPGFPSAALQLRTPVFTPPQDPFALERLKQGNALELLREKERLRRIPSVADLREQHKATVIQQYGPAALRGDQDALAELGAVDPQMAVNVQKQHLDNTLGRLQQMGRLGRSILEAPPEARPALYKKGRALAGFNGMDISQWPEEYPGDDEIKTAVGMATTIGQRIELMKQDPKLAEKLAEARARGKRRGDPLAGRTASPAQTANNAEIQAARQRIRRRLGERQPGESMRDYIGRATQKATNTGRPNPIYDESLERDFRTASQHLVGDDPGFDVFWAQMQREASTPAPVPPPRPPRSSTKEPGLLERLFGGGSSPTSAPAVPAPAPTRENAVRRAREAGGGLSPERYQAISRRALAGEPVPEGVLRAMSSAQRRALIQMLREGR